MNLSLWLEVIDLPNDADKNLYGLKLKWRNPPKMRETIYATKTWAGHERKPPEKDLIKLSTEALMDLLANQYGMETEWPKEIQTWWCIYRCHRHYIRRTIVDTVRNASYTSL